MVVFLHVRLLRIKGKFIQIKILQFIISSNYLSYDTNELLFLSNFQEVYESLKQSMLVYDMTTLVTGSSVTLVAVGALCGLVNWVGLTQFPSLWMVQK